MGKSRSGLRTTDRSGVSSAPPQADPPAVGAAAPFGRMRGLVGVGICGVLLVGHLTLALLAVSGKSATYDEPLHLAAGWARLSRLDFRSDPEEPPLAHYWSALPLLLNPPQIPEDSLNWRMMPGDVTTEFPYSAEFLYRTPGNDADAMLWEARRMMVLVSVALGALLCWWAWKLAGAVAAVAAAVLYGLDPNILAHAPLAKNDISFALAFVAVVAAVWLVGRRVTLPRLLGVVVAVTVALCVKFSGVAAAGIFTLLLAVRALVPQPWEVWRWTASSLGARMAGAGAVWLAVALAAWVGIWACYGFRYAPTPEDPSARFPLRAWVRTAAVAELSAADEGGTVTPAQVQQWRPGLLMALIMAADQQRLLPHTWLAGLFYVDSATKSHPSYLLGETRLAGRPGYFPIAMLSKTPLATLLLVGTAGVLGALQVRCLVGHWSRLWTSLCIAIPLLAFGLTTITSSFNLGLRHILPLYPLLFLAVAVAVADAVRRWPRGTVAVGVVLGVGMLVETLAAYPNYIPFFNAAAGGSRGGIRVLGDSNLDWGQDLTTLAHWRQQRPDGVLYLAYFGTADPAYYGLKFTDMARAGVPRGPTTLRPSEVGEPGYLAVSATVLQAIYERGEVAAEYKALRERHRPLAVLGGSIYVYRVPFDR